MTQARDQEPGPSNWGKKQDSKFKALFSSSKGGIALLRGGVP